MVRLWHAQRLDDIKEGGRTHPLVVECMREAEDEEDEGDGTAVSERTLMVVKALGLPEVTERGLFNETFGNLLARRLGVETPMPALVDLSSAFVDAVKPILVPKGLTLQPGVAAGCQYFSEGFAPLEPGRRLRPEELPQAAAIYGLDLMVQNPDRRVEKPNCAIRSGRLVAFDFEMAFSFVLLVGAADPPWQVAQLAFARQHLFYRELRGRELDWRPLLAAVADLTDPALNELLGPIPASWRAAEAKVRAHLAGIRENLSSFGRELQGSLA